MQQTKNAKLMKSLCDTYKELHGMGSMKLTLSK
jgi:hypothetical protein